jgi:hypothetical protein
MKAETLTLVITVRPSYGEAEKHVKPEIAESLDWLTVDHDAIRLEWGAVGEGEWPDDPDDIA